MESVPQIFKLPLPDGLDILIQVLSDHHYTVIGPRVASNVIGLGVIRCSNDLPRGITDHQEKASYRVRQSSDEGYFGFNLGPRSFKSYLFPPDRILWTLGSGDEKVISQTDQTPLPSYAFLGVRACELAAIEKQDVILSGTGRDSYYQAVRERSLIIGVQCRTAAATCFCPSMGTGPNFPDMGYDLLISEFPETLFIQSGSKKGQEILEHLRLEKASDEASGRISDQARVTRSQIQRTMPQQHIKEDIYAALPSSHWEDVGQRCLACANCTMVCPTCFCSTVIDTLDVSGQIATRSQSWDSCFHLGFTHMHGGSHRVSNASRYRQWMSHKLATWIDQFGSSGCVGCGRCITWCPVGIDLTEEMANLRTATLSRMDSDADP